MGYVPIFNKKKKKVDEPRIERGTSRMQSEHSTTELHAQSDRWSAGYLLYKPPIAYRTQVIYYEDLR